MLTVLAFIGWLLNLYGYALFARILLSWFPDVQRSAFGRVLATWTEPYFSPFRRVIPSLPFGRVRLDVSSYVALIAYIFVYKAIMGLLVLLFQSVGLI